MNIRSMHVAGLTLIVLLTGVGGGYWLANRGMQDTASMSTMAANDSASQGETAHRNREREILYWHDPMFPQHKFDTPGKSPFMDMDLVPVYADESAGTNTVRIDPALAQSLGVRTATAEPGTFWRRVDTVGTVQADERRISVLQSRAAGWLEKLHLRAVNDPVKRGMPVAEIYAPELLAAQEEFLLLLSRPHSGSALLDAARERLSLLGLGERQIRTLEQRREPTRRVVLHAPASGIVTEIGAREGAAVSPGMPVVSIVDLSRVWIVAAVPEMQLSWIRTGSPAEAVIEAMPGEKYEGEVEYIYPDVDPQTRTVKVRFTTDNPEHQLRPGMVTSVTLFGGPKRDVLLVPQEAVIRTGERNVIVVEESAGRFRAQEVKIGLASGNQVEITDGLKAGERVVVSGQFLIDSEASLRGAISRLGNGAEEAEAERDSASEDAGETREHVAEGRVEKVDPKAGKVVISHGPVPSLEWPPMTMGFVVRDKALLEQLEPGQAIEFRFVETEDAYEVTGANVNSGAAQ
ncbi:MAG TPA: efflux RND transporter periplasmic adaptor subunit [Burkholderiales bacterium]|nr:efflux RND transporter periplasmic adaptor subunit [Burkholderiales bacterium]